MCLTINCWQVFALLACMVAVDGSLCHFCGQLDPLACAVSTIYKVVLQRWLHGYEYQVYTFPPLSVLQLANTCGDVC